MNEKAKVSPVDENAKNTESCKSQIMIFAPIISATFIAVAALLSAHQNDDKLKKMEKIMDEQGQTLSVLSKEHKANCEARYHETFDEYTAIREMVINRNTEGLAQNCEKIKKVKKDFSDELEKCDYGPSTNYDVQSNFFVKLDDTLQKYCSR